MTTSSVSHAEVSLPRRLWLWLQNCEALPHAKPEDCYVGSDIDVAEKQQQPQKALVSSVSQSLSSSSVVFHFLTKISETAELFTLNFCLCVLQFVFFCFCQSYHERLMAIRLEQEQIAKRAANVKTNGGTEKKKGKRRVMVPLRPGDVNALLDGTVFAVGFHKSMPVCSCF